MKSRKMRRVTARYQLLTLPLSTVAAQYGSRLLRVFLGDRITQLVLGMFVATFIYCLAGALSIPPVDVEPEGPQVTATLGLVLMLATFSSLILLVQHISTMLQAPNIAAAAGAELQDVVRAEIPGEIRSGDDRKGGWFETHPNSQEAAETPVHTDDYAVRVRQDGKLRLVLEQVNFAELLDGAFDMMRHLSCDNASVLQHMLKVITAVSQETHKLEARQEPHRHISLIQAESQAGALIEKDRQRIHQISEALVMKLSERG